MRRGELRDVGCFEAVKGSLKSNLKRHSVHTDAGISTSQRQQTFTEKGE